MKLEAPEFDYETRRYYDTVTWLAETLPGSMRSPTEYNFDGWELYGQDGSALGDIFQDSVEAATLLPPYEQRRRRIEMNEYKDMVSMMKGDRPNTMVVISDFPPELLDASEDVGGYNVSRKQTMLRIIYRTNGRTLKMFSQSLDGSDRQALEKLYETLNHQANPGELLSQRMFLDTGEADQEFLVDQLTGVYDRSLRSQYGGNWYAGRRSGRIQNTYEFAREQTDLLDAYFATTHSFTGGLHEYNLAAAIKERYLSRENEVRFIPSSASVVAHLLALEEMDRAGSQAKARGETVSGCGATINGDSNIIGTQNQLNEAGYGNKSNGVGEDKFGSLKFKCQKGHENIRPRNKLIERCTTCKVSLKC